MLVVSNISKQFAGADSPILKDISFVVNAGERVGLVGRNGAGKSTLLNIIRGALAPDQGSVMYDPPRLRLGYLAQGIAPDDASPIRSILYPQWSALQAAEAEVERLGEALSSTADLDAALLAYGEALERLESLSAAVDSGRAEKYLAALELAELDLDAPVGILSGGQKTRLGLAALLVAQPQLLILDEPTNHLDIVALEWLEDWLSKFEGGALIVSHDRTFLDKVVNRIVALDDQTHTAQVYEGDYSDYAASVRSALDRQWAQWRDQQVEIARMEADISFTMGKALKVENNTSPNQPSLRRLAKKVAKRAKSKEKRLERYLAADERVEKPKAQWNLKLDFDELPSTGRDVLFLENLSIGYSANSPLLSRLNLTVGAGERVVITGANGHGKSTLLKTIVGQLPPLAGQVRLGSSITVGYLAQEQDSLPPQESPVQLVQALQDYSHTEARSFLHFFLFEGDDALRPVHMLSYGERSRLMLALLVAQGANLLLLDEPINHLDVASREQFEQALKQFRGSVLAVVHDRYFVDQFASTVWQVEAGALRVELRSPSAVMG